MSHTVLICDDAPYIRTVIAEILKRGGYHVIGEAASGAEAITRYQELKPDLVTIDIVMRDMNGLDAVKAIRKLDGDARIMMCSALGQQSLVNETLAAGAREFVLKPFDASRLLEAARNALA